MRGMRKWKRWAVFLLLFGGAGGGRKPDGAGGNAGYDKI